MAPRDTVDPSLILNNPRKRTATEKALADANTPPSAHQVNGDEKASSPSASPTGPPSHKRQKRATENPNVPRRPRKLATYALDQICLIRHFPRKFYVNPPTPTTHRPWLLRKKKSARPVVLDSDDAKEGNNMWKTKTKGRASKSDVIDISDF